MKTMTVDGVRSIQIGVPDLETSKAFYTNVWGLTPVFETGAAAYLRATGAYHHVLTLSAHEVPALLRVDLTAPNREAVASLYERLQRAGVKGVQRPARIEEPGGGYGFAFEDPEGRAFRILTEDERHDDIEPAMALPTKISHLVLNSIDRARSVAFFADVLGFRIVDRTRAMTFLCCNTDHHSVAIVEGGGTTLNHVAFEVPDLESVMRGAGRLRDYGYSIEWGVGRHGPGHNVFAYFVGPNNEPIEYTAEVQQIDDGYQVGEPSKWTWPAGRNDHWGIAYGPSEALMSAQTALRFAPRLEREISG